MAYELATGGTITVDTASLVEHTFTTGGTFALIDPGSLPVDYLVVGGGAGGGGWTGGGGGSGEALTGAAYNVTASKTVTIGTGGIAGVGSKVSGGNGASSVFGAFTALGGGGGAANGTSAGASTPGALGTGGGGSYINGPGGVATGTGGDGGAADDWAGPDFATGGGGGAVGNGGNGGVNVAGVGGVGVEWPAASGTYYGGGGGGGIFSGTGGAGGSGGGGAGAGGSAAIAGTANTGGGGGGGGTNGAYASGAGGTGVVIVRYDPADFVSWTAVQAAETDLAQPVGAVRGLFAAVTQTAETDSARPVTAALNRLVGQAAETDSATMLIREQLVPLVQAAETDSAQPIAPARVYPVGQATETDFAESIGDRITVFLTNETDLAQPITANKTKAIGQATETDSATALSFVSGFQVGTITAAPLIGPFIEQGYVQDEILINSIPSATVMTGALWIANDDSSPFSPTVSVVLIDEDGVTVVAGNPLATAFNVSWFDELNGPGFGTLDLMLSETAAVAEINLHRFVRCYLGAVEAFTWRIEEEPQIVEIAGDEEYGQMLQVKGRGWASVLDDAIVYPVIGVGETTPDLTSPWLGPDRVFSFASPDYPDLAAHPSLWPNVQSYYDYGTLQPGRFERVETSEDVWESLPSPVGLPFPASEVYPQVIDPLRNHPHWIWPNHNPFVEGWGFFIGDLLYPDTSRSMTITVSADNLFTLFVDGTPVLGENVDTWMWKGWKEVTTNILTNRKYRFACAVRNTAGGGYNPGGFLLSCTYGDENNVIQDVAMVSNLDWRGLYSTSAWPGWTAGEIILQLVNEANTRRPDDPMVPIAYGFNGNYGSDGATWVVEIDGTPTVHIPWFSASLGSSYLEALDALHQDGWVNWRMSSGSLTLQMWSFDSPAYNSGATYTAGVNIRSLERTSSKRYANVLLVSYEGGFVEVRDAAAIALYGYHEDVLSSDATSVDEAQRIGGSELVKRSRDPEGGAIIMEIEPVDDTDTPYLGFMLGDGVTVPSLQGGTALVRVMSVSVKQDELGDPEFIVELNKRWPVQDRDLNRILRTIGGKTLGQAGDRGKVT